MRKWASGAKLKRLVVDIIRSGGEKQARRQAFIEYHAEANGVHPRTIARILDGKSWRITEGRVLPPGESKQCAVCGVEFGRNWPNGRRRSDKFWNQKRTCSHHCCVKLAWAEGQYESRRGPRPNERKGKKKQSSKKC